MLQDIFPMILKLSKDFYFGVFDFSMALELKTLFSNKSSTLCLQASQNIGLLIYLRNVNQAPE